MKPLSSMSMPEFSVSPLHLWPADAILAVQARAYAPHLIEQAEALQGKVQAARPDQPLSWGVVRAAAPDVLCGYAIACPWRSGMAPALGGQRLPPPAHEADCLYVHDIAIDPDYHGQGLAAQLMQHVLVQGRAYGWRQAVLVAVQGAHRYWSRHGFVAEPFPGGLEDAGFGADAVWMRRAL